MWKLAETCRRLYNLALAERKYLYQVYHYSISYTEQQNALPSLKQRFPQYKWVYSKVLQMTLRKLDSAYKAFHGLRRNGDHTARPPNFRGKNYFFTLCYNQSGFQVTSNKIRLSHNHPSKIELCFIVPIDFTSKRIKQIELFYDRSMKRFFLSVYFKQKNPPYVDNQLYQAFDLGITNIVSAVNSQGKFIQFQNRRPDLYWRRKIANLISNRDHCYKYSRRWHWYNRKLRKMWLKCNNQLKDFQHKVSKTIVFNTRANNLILGNLSVKKMIQKGNNTLNYSLQNTGFMSRFVEFVTYKAKKIGKRVIRINEAYTTQICAKCGRIQNLKLRDRFINCNCGHQLDRDLNSAINILAKFYLVKNQFADLLQEPSVDEESFFKIWKGFLRQTANGKTKVPSSALRRFSGLVENPVLSGVVHYI
jgi:putative transposase